MERAVYAAMLRQQDRHWWYRGRRAVLRALIQRHGGLPEAGVRILEAGCGPGGNLAMLGAFGPVDAFDADPWSVEQAQMRYASARLMPGSLPDGLPAELAGPYDLIAALDVIEHLDQPVAALKTLAARLGPEARLLVTVPAYPWMFSAHDRAHHHRRRYTAGLLRQHLAEAGLEPMHLTHFNAVLLLPALLVRGLQRVFPSLEGDDERHGSTGWINAGLARLFAAEAPIAARLGLPVGLSIGCVARRISPAFPAS